MTEFYSMDNEIITEKNWWRRNVKWAAPVMIIIACAASYFIFSGNNNYLSDFARAYADMPLYEDAVKQAGQNKRAAEVLGTIEPIDKMTIAEGTAAYTDDGKSMTSTITVKGSKGRGKMDIAADKADGKWKYRYIKIRIKNPKEEIVVLPVDPSN
jgi:hypothetical protein